MGVFSVSVLRVLTLLLHLLLFLEANEGTVISESHYFILNNRILIKEGQVGKSCDPNFQFDCLSIPNSSCSPKFPQFPELGGNCVCDPGFYHDGTSHRCLPLPQYLGDLCLLDEQCSSRIPFSYCPILPPNSKGQCQCDSNHGADPFGNFCLIGKRCTKHSDCPLPNTFCADEEFDPNSEDYKRTCKCNADFYEVLGQDCVKIGSAPRDRSTTTTSPIAKPGPLPEIQIQPVTCRGTDGYGIIWEGMAGQDVQIPCSIISQNHIGSANWRCGSNGRFVGDYPDYSDCQTGWILQKLASLDQMLEQHMENVSIEDVSDFLNQVSTHLESAMSNAKEDAFFGHEIGSIMGLIESIAGNLSCSDVGLDQLEKAFLSSAESCERLLKYEEPWGQLDAIERADHLYDLMDLFERNSYLLLISRVKDSTLNDQIRFNKSYDSNTNGLSILAGAERITPRIFLPTGPGEGVLGQELTITNGFGSGDSFIQLPINWTRFYNSENDGPATCVNNNGAKFAAMEIEAGLVQDKFGHKLMEGDGILSEDKDMNTKLLSFSFLKAPQPQMMLPKSKSLKSVDLEGGLIKLRFKHDKRATRTPIPFAEYSTNGRTCAFWDADNQIWSTKGCKVNEEESDEYYTTCECNHLTSFSVLMGKHVKDEVLQVFTLVLCILSAISLLVTIILLQFNQNLNKLGQTTIIQHICGTLLVGNLLIIFQNPIEVEKISGALCMSVGIGTHFAFLAAFMWMGIMGWHIFRIIVFVFSDMGKTYSVAYPLVGYGVPGIFVALIAAVGRKDAYSWDQESYCWLRGSYVYSFMIPIGIIIIANGVIFCITLKITQNLKNFKTIRATRAKSQKPNIIGFFSLSLTLGLTWIFGYLQLIDNSSVSAYIFTILNASQGILILIFQYLLKEKMQRDNLKRKTINSNSRFSDQSRSDGSFDHGVRKGTERKPDASLRRQSTVTSYDLKQTPVDSDANNNYGGVHLAIKREEKDISEIETPAISKCDAPEDSTPAIFTIGHSTTFPLTADMNYLIQSSSSEDEGSVKSIDPIDKKSDTV